MALPVVQREGKMACWDLHNLELYEPGRGLQPFSCVPPVTTMASASPLPLPVSAFTNLSVFQNAAF